MGGEHCELAISSIEQKYSAFKKTGIFLISICSISKINKFMTTFGSKLKGKSKVDGSNKGAKARPLLNNPCPKVLAQGASFLMLHNRRLLFSFHI